MSKFINKHPLVFLILFCILAYGFNLTGLPISIMEARNFNVAKEMLTGGNWFLTTMNAVPRYEKPPLPSWITSAFISFDLNSLFLYRIPTSLIAALGVIFIYFLTKVLSNRKQIALMSALILGTSFYYITIRFEAPSDTYTHVFMIGSLLFMAKAIKNKQYLILNICLAIVFLGCSILSKGPVSLYALYLPFIIAYFIVYKNTKQNYLISLISLVMGFGLGAIWYIYVRVEDPAVFTKIASKETSNWASYNVRPFYYYWSFFIQSGVWTIPALLSLFYPYFKAKVIDKKLYQFSWLWTALAVILLSVIPEKKSRYLVPVLIPLALNTAQLIHYQIKTKKLDKVSQIGMKFHYLLLLIIGISVVTAPYFIEVRTTEFWVWYYCLVLLMFGFGAAVFFNYSPLHLKKLFYATLVLITIITSVGLYGIKFMQQNNDYRTLAEANLNKDDQVYYFKTIRPEAIWESGVISKPINFEDNQPEGVFKVIIEKYRIAEFKEILPVGYSIQKIEIYDRNFFISKEKSRHKDNHVNYVLTLKY
ncbi:MAG: glycosyltransferase family 39 protein [Psychroflexus sp.]|nr:glycosyltransferase family 39 protein [Psychroflexus sp.]